MSDLKARRLEILRKRAPRTRTYLVARESVMRSGMTSTETDENIRELEDRFGGSDR